jgi:hypothetical protein
MEEIIISQEVRTFLKELTTTLHQKQYFAFPETAQEYVNTLIEGILKLPTATHHVTPQELINCGRHYVKLKGNKRTMWYVFFEKSGNRYLIQFITNNYSPQSAYLNRL